MSLFDNDVDEVNMERIALPDAVIEELQKLVRQSNKYSLEETHTRNVLMVGKTRSGKSTAVGVLKDPCFIPKGMSIFSDTVDPKFASFSLDDTKVSTKFTFNVIDTPGLKEVKAIGEDARSDKAIMNTIQYCLKNEITKVNVLLIFISFELGVNVDDLDSFATFLEMFGHNDISICMCITRAEDKPKSWRDEMIRQLNQHQYFSKVLQRPNVTVVFIGCVDSIRIQTVGTRDELLGLYTSVYRLREQLLKVIFAAEKQVRLIDLPISTGLTKDVNNLFIEQDKLLSHFEKATDFVLADNRLKVSEFAANIDHMMTGMFLLDHSLEYDLSLIQAVVSMRVVFVLRSTETCSGS